MRERSVSIGTSCSAMRRQPSVRRKAVGRDLALAEHLRQSTRGDVPAHVHLPEAVLRVHVALGEEQVLDRVGVEVGHAQVVADDRHRWRPARAP